MSDTKNENSLIECMREVPDPRAPYNQKHKFLDIIIIAVTAILCGMDTWNEIEDWACSTVNASFLVFFVKSSMVIFKTIISKLL